MIVRRSSKKRYVAPQAARASCQARIASCAGQASVDSGDRVIHDKHNPDPLLRQRKLCGLTILWGLHARGLNYRMGGWFHNPDDGTTYRVSAKLVTPDLLVARIYLGIPLFGRIKPLHRVLHGTSKGWC